MIVSTPRPINDLLDTLKQFKSILVMGCQACVTIGKSGGEENVDTTITALELGLKQMGLNPCFKTTRIPRQCEKEMLELAPELTQTIEFRQFNAILSFGCAAGVQALAEKTLTTPVIPALNTRFIGAPSGNNKWEIRCIGCGDCFLHKTRGVCVLALCPRKMQNSSCGNEDDQGNCDVNLKQRCVWNIIRSRFNRSFDKNLDSFEDSEFVPPRNWAVSSGGGICQVYDSNHIGK